MIFLSQTTGDSKRCLRCWCFCCFWSPDWWNFIQSWGSIVLLPSEGRSLSCWLLSISDPWNIRSCGEGMSGHNSLHWICCLFPENSFFCAMIAAITLKVLDPFGTGKIVLFQVTYDKVSIFKLTVRRHFQFFLFIRTGEHLNWFPLSSLGFLE